MPFLSLVSIAKESNVFFNRTYLLRRIIKIDKYYHFILTSQDIYCITLIGTVLNSESLQRLVPIAIQGINRKWR